MVLVQDLVGELKEKQYLTNDVLFLSFAIPDTFSFQAGQFIMFKIEWEEVVRWKSYSILSPPSKKGYLDFCIKIIEGGFASEAFKELSLGARLPIKGPFGHFLFVPEAEEQWFICAGTGITPLYSIITEFLGKYPYLKFVLLFGVRMKKNLFFHQELQVLAQNHPNFVYIPTLSQEEWGGKMGRIQKHLPQNPDGKMFYICGLKELVLETQQLLLQRGVEPARIKFERYT